MCRKLVTRHHRVNYTRYARLIHSRSQEILLQTFHWLYKGKSMTLKEFYEKNPECFEKLPGHFLRDIKIGKQPEEMDFSDVYSLLQSVCGLAKPNDPIWYKGDKLGTNKALENALYQIKTRRNHFSHPTKENYMEISDKDLDTALKEFQGLFEIVLTSSAKKAGINDKKLKSAISKMNKDLQIERYGDDSVANEELMKICLEELSDQISKFPEMPYLKPQLEEKLTDEKVEGQSKFTDRRQHEIFYLNVLLDRQTLTKQSPKVLLLSGSAGSGKTSLCRFLAGDWLSKSTSVRHLGKYDLVLSLACTNITTRDLHYLLRRDLLPKATALLDTLQLLTFLKGHKILWLVDGWDEAKDDAKTLVSDLVRKVEQEWIFHTVLITSRPNRISEILHIISNQDTFLQVCLLGIDVSEQRELLQLHSKGSHTPYDCNSVKKFLDIVNGFNISVREDLKNPLKFLLMFRIWAENPSQVITGSLSILYDAIKDSYKKRLLTKLREPEFPSDNDSESLEAAITTWLKELSNITFGSLIRNEGLFLSSQDIKTLRNVCGPSVASHCLSTFLEYQEQTDIIKSNQYSFSHSTQKIFFASLHLVNILNESENPEQRLNEFFQQNISRFEFSHAIDQFLGVYDILNQIQLVLLGIVSKVSNGFLWPHLQSQHIGALIKSTVMKVIDILTNFYTNQKPKLYNCYEFVSVLFNTLEIQSVKDSLDRWPIRSLMKVIYLSISEDSESLWWLEVLRICQYNQYVLQDVIQYIDPQKWEVSDAHLKSAWELMCYVVPQKIRINISGDPKKLPDLEILLHLVRKHRIVVELNLFYQMFDFGGNDQSDIYLDILCSRDSKCILTTFSGYLNSQNFHILQKASYLRILSIRVMDSKTVKQIYDTTSKLKCLKAIFITYDLKSYPYIDKPLEVRGYFGISLLVSLSFPHLEGTNVKSAAKFICQFCENYFIIFTGKMGKRDIKEISSILAKRNVTVNNLYTRNYLLDLIDLLQKGLIFYKC
ncbi:uncharacterized protein [Palaemon carinicauda]|uniref:uncharacterized protein n=1 Tax=Palaemon carinicauda TaxID=392227 RepID=UPI0035B6A00F